VLEEAHSALHVEFGGIRGEMLCVRIELYVAASRSHVRLRVVLHVVGAQSQISILDIDFPVRDVYVAFLPLLLGFQAHTGGPGRRWRSDFLRIGSPNRKDTGGQNEKDAPSAYHTEFMKESPQLTPPVERKKKEPIWAMLKIAR